MEKIKTAKPKKVKAVVEAVEPELLLATPVIPHYVVTLKNEEVISFNGSKPVKYPVGTYEVSKEVFEILKNSGRI